MWGVQTPAGRKSWRVWTAISPEQPRCGLRADRGRDCSPTRAGPPFAPTALACERRAADAGDAARQRSGVRDRLRAPRRRAAGVVPAHTPLPGRRRGGASTLLRGRVVVPPAPGPTPAGGAEAVAVF